MATIDYEHASAVLDELFAAAEANFESRQPPAVSSELALAAKALFTSPTQSYREALLGCALARHLNRTINIRRPYINQGDDAFNGRTVDERVINPFLQHRLIPSSKGPYLASFRRSVEFTPETAKGLRDKHGYKAFLTFLEAIAQGDAHQVRHLLLYLLYQFVELRNAATIPLARIRRMSMEQYEKLLEGLLQLPSGGLIPVLLVVAMLRTIKQCFSLSWEIECQGINVADKASGAGADITVRQAGIVILARRSDRANDR